MTEKQKLENELMQANARVESFTYGFTKDYFTPRSLKDVILMNAKRKEFEAKLPQAKEEVKRLEKKLERWK